MLEPIELTGLLSCASRKRQLLMCRVSGAKLSCPGRALGSGLSGSTPLKPNRTAHGKWLIAQLANIGWVGHGARAWAALPIVAQLGLARAAAPASGDAPNRPGSRTAHAAVALGRI